MPRANKERGRFLWKDSISARGEKSDNFHKNMRHPLIAIITAVLLINQSHAQGLPSLKKVYSYRTYSMLHSPIKYTLYYIIKNEHKRINGRLYRPLIFSEDSTHLSGYVRYDSADKRIYWIRKDEGQNDFKDIIFNKEYPLISFFNDTLNDRGDTIISTSKNNDSVFIVTIKTKAASDTVYLEGMSFLKGEFYPHTVVILDPFFDKDIEDVVVEAE